MSIVAPKTHKKLSARVFSRGDVSCPHCKTKTSEPLEICPQCGFRLSACSEILGTHAPPLDFTLDPGKALPANLEERLTPAYQKIQRKFPQISLTLCFVELNPPLKVHELAFWLMNVAPNPSQDRAWKIAIVFEIAKYEAGLASGYSIEPFLKQQAWADLLQQTTVSAHRDDWTPALQAMLEDIVPLLEEAKRDAIARTKKSRHDN